MTGERVLWPVAFEWVTVQDAEILNHAVPLSSARDEKLTAVCGVEGATLMGERLPVGWRVMEWPPFAFGRCKKCWTATGKPRVPKDSPWRRT